MRSKFQKDDAEEIISWISSRTNIPYPTNDYGQDAFRDWLLDGHVLCALINSFGLPGIACKPKDCTRIKLAAMRNAQEAENIEMFLKACEQIGMERLDMFQTVNIKDNTNMAQVLNTLMSLGSVAKSRGVSGPLVGVKMAEKNTRHFDEQTQREGRNIIGLQMGTNQGASQKGMTGYGQQRQINHQTN